MDTINQQVIDTVNLLISIAEDGKEGYKHAATDVKDSVMEEIFLRYSKQREFYIVQLQQQVAKLGGSPEHSGGPLGALHRTWMDMKSIFTSGDRNAIINACLTGEEAAVKKYSDALKDENITDYLRLVLEEQLSGIQQAINEIKLKITE